MQIYINDILIDEDSYAELSNEYKVFNDEFFKLGGISASNINLKLESNALDDIENPNIIKIIDGNGLYGIFNITKIEKQNERFHYIEAMDNMFLLENNYDASAIVPCALKEIYFDICNQNGVEAGNDSFLNDDIEVFIYDNTITAREFLSYISEVAGGFAQFGTDGKLYIRSLADTPVYDVDYDSVGESKIGRTITISRVVFDNGLLHYEAGTTDGETIYISPNNMYVDKQSVVDNIYNKLKGFTITGFSGKAPMIDGLAGSRIKFNNGITSIAQYSKSYAGGWSGIYDFPLNITSQQEQIIAKSPTNKKVRNLESKFNYLEGKVEIISTEVDDQNEKIASITLTTDEINQRVSNTENKVIEITEEVEEVNHVIESLQKQVDGEISTWFLEGTPTANNYPANTWLTEAERLKHEGDIFYSKDTGSAYRWVYELDYDNPKKNLFNKAEIDTNRNMLYCAGTGIINQAVGTYTYVVPCEPNTAYTASRKILNERFQLFSTPAYPVIGATARLSNSFVNNTDYSVTLTTGETDKYLSLFWCNTNVDTSWTAEEMASGIQIEKGAQKTEYESYEPSKVFYWYLIPDTDVTEALALANEALATAQNKITTYWQDEEPMNASNGDIWFTSDGRQQVLVDGSWVMLDDSRFADIFLNHQGLQQEVLNNEKTIENLEKELAEFRVTTETQFIQTNEDFNFKFITEYLPLLNDIENITDEKLAQIEQYIRFVSGNILLGASDSSFSLQISKEKISFMDGATEMAYFSNNTLYVANIIAANELRSKNWRLVEETNGSFSIKKVG